MSSEPHFPLAPQFPSLQHTTLWTEMEVLQCRVAFCWEPGTLQLSLEQDLLQTSKGAPKPRALCSPPQAGSAGLSKGSLSLREGCRAVG